MSRMLKLLQTIQTKNCFNFSALPFALIRWAKLLFMLQSVCFLSAFSFCLLLLASRVYMVQKKRFVQLMVHCDDKDSTEWSLCNQDCATALQTRWSRRPNYVLWLHAEKKLAWIKHFRLLWFISGRFLLCLHHYLVIIKSFYWFYIMNHTTNRKLYPYDSPFDLKCRKIASPHQTIAVKSKVLLKVFVSSCWSVALRIIFRWNVYIFSNPSESMCCRNTFSRFSCRSLRLVSRCFDRLQTESLVQAY